MNTQKSLLREQARKHRDSHDVFAEDIEAATSIFFDAIKPEKSHIVAGYWPKGREFDPTHILEACLDRGHVCALPKIQKGTQRLKFMPWKRDTVLQKSTFGIMEPEDTTEILPDILLVPMLSFDRKGYRLGQGGGYYDATLEHLRSLKNIIAIGIGFTSQGVLFNLPIEPHDQRMDYILTPLGITRYTDI